MKWFSLALTRSVFKDQFTIIDDLSIVFASTERLLAYLGTSILK